MRMGEITMQDTIGHLSDFAAYLRTEERSEGTIEKYMRDVRKFFCWLADKTLEKCRFPHSGHSCLPMATHRKRSIR